VAEEVLVVILEQVDWGALLQDVFHILVVAQVLAVVVVLVQQVLILFILIMAVTEAAV
jgi:hypothetical protein